ncbi:hypothetical protein HL667_11550 [Bradyrhizobium sp. 83012]|uniref:Uncharacterized protein n=1 Tax=Bradyrhizobium aeschynomenes TaxID=2734909 RepID=A0ABX2CBM7_9BRAD|nr:hypothetical protein [Bradyrhizobium aeschynomenes]NPU65631.1 hypothetical protein [Bradyrhizobium aeschynomenes]
MQVTSILLVIVLPFAWAVLKLFNSLRTMQVKVGVGLVLSRYDNPRLFWLLVGLQSLAIGVLLAVLYAAYVVLPNQIAS